MSQLIDNLNIIESVKTDIKSAIEAKGMDMTGISFPGYASKIGEISGGGGWDQKSFTEGTIEIINLDNSASFVASGVFKNNNTIKTVNLPYATSVGMEAFFQCRLTQINLPVCSYIGESAFAYCQDLNQVSIPVCSYLSSGVFYYCNFLRQVSLPVCSYIGNRVFDTCYRLSIITIGYSSVCSLYASNVFQDAGITSSTGSIYVPASLVDAYKSATNWSYFSTQIFPIE